MPVGPVDAASLDVDIHGIDADALVTLEGLLISRMGVAGEQAADLIVVSDIQDLINIADSLVAAFGNCDTCLWDYLSLCIFERLACNI